MEITEHDEVLFVDDDNNVLASIRRGLNRESFGKLFAQSPEEALDYLARNKNIRVIVTDLKMPGMDGLALLKKVEELYPDVVRVILTGFTHISTILAAVNNRHIYRYLTKPWKLEEEFVPTIRQAIEHYYILKDARFLQHIVNEQKATIAQLEERLEQCRAEHQEEIKVIKEKIYPHLMDIIHETGVISLGDEKYARISKALKLKAQFIHSYLSKMMESIVAQDAGNQPKENE